MLLIFYTFSVANSDFYSNFDVFFIAVVPCSRVAEDWIRIWIRNPDPDPDPGGQKLPTKVENFFKSSCFEELDGLFES